MIPHIDQFMPSVSQLKRKCGVLLTVGCGHAGVHRMAVCKDGKGVEIQ